MGWDQSTARQPVQAFLLELMGIDPNQLLEEALQTKLDEAGLTYEEAPAEGREEGDGMYEVFTPDVITISDGRVFIEALTKSTQGDDWGNDCYSFVEVGKPFEFVRNNYCGCEDDPHVSKEECISTYMLPDPDTRQSGSGLHPARDLDFERNEISFGEGKKFSPDEIREQGGEFGDAIADFMQKQGLNHISFEPGDNEDEDQHHYRCKDLTGCHPLCALAQDDAGDDLGESGSGLHPDDEEE